MTQTFKKYKSGLQGVFSSKVSTDPLQQEDPVLLFIQGGPCKSYHVSNDRNFFSFFNSFSEMCQGLI